MTHPDQSRCAVFRGKAFPYFLLAGSVLLLGWWFYWYLGLPTEYSGDRYANGIVAIMLILNCLVFQFEWSNRLISSLLRYAAVAWIVFAVSYVFCLSRLLGG